MYSPYAPTIPTEVPPKAKAYPIIKKQMSVIMNMSMFLMTTNYLFFFLTCADSINVYPIDMRNMNDVDESVHAVVND